MMKTSHLKTTQTVVAVAALVFLGAAGIWGLPVDADFRMMLMTLAGLVFGAAAIQRPSDKAELEGK